MATVDERPGHSNAKKIELVALLALFGVALALRWWRLDLMPFRFDAAEALIRTRETLSLGHPPRTGIVNSLGFRNPAGLEWLILPPALLSADPRAAAGWIGVLVASGIFALWWCGWLLGGRSLAWSAALLYAFLPQTVFSSRDIWAQHLLIPLGAWSLALRLHALQGAKSDRATGSPTNADDESAAEFPQPAGTSSSLPNHFSLLLLATALAGVAALVHLAASLWFAALFIATLVHVLKVPMRHARRNLALCGILLAGFVCLAAPSFLDWHTVRTNPPQEKPPHVRKFEQMAPPPKALAGRMAEAYAGVFDPLASLQTLVGIEQELPDGVILSTRFTDLALLCLALSGLALCLLAALPQTISSRSVPLETQPARLLLAWSFFPPAVTGALMRYPNGTYFYFALGATLLIVCLGARWLVIGLSSRMRKQTEQAATQPRVARLLPLVFALLALLHVIFYVVSMQTLDRVRVVNGPYYMPLREQLGLVGEFDKAGIGRGHLFHLGGPWFQRSFDYLLHELLKVPPRAAAVVAEDTLLRRSQPARLRFVEKSLDRQWGTIRWRLFPTWEEAVEFANAFYHLPLE